MSDKSREHLPPGCRELYDRGRAALRRQNWDYAIAIFNQVLQKEPAFYDCREALRACQYKKAGTGTGFFKRFLGSASNSPLLARGQMVLRSNPEEALHLAEQILNGDPNNVSAHKLLAEAALEADLPRTASLSLEIAHKHAPKDKEIGLRLGEALARSGQVAKAESIYRELERTYPNYQAIVQALKNAVASRTMAEGGYEALSSGEGSYRDILKDKAETISLEQEKREVKSQDVVERLLGEQEARLAKEPGNQALMRSIAELLAQQKQFDRALEYYQRLMQTEGVNDPSLEQTVAELMSRKFDHALEQLDRTDPEYEQNKARLEGEKRAYRVTEAERRVEKYPNDLGLRFELGQLYLEEGRVSEAIQEFQKAQANPHRRVAAMTRLGECFARRGMNDLAARTFQNAIKEKQVFDEEKKELVYRLGTVQEKMGRKEEAMEQFKQIYEVDIGYRDVAAKVDAYYGGT